MKNSCKKKMENEKFITLSPRDGANGDIYLYNLLYTKEQD